MDLETSKLVSLNSSFEIVPMQVDDLDCVVALEASLFPIPNRKETFLAELSRGVSRLVVVRETGTSSILGYMNFWIVCDECELHTLAVSREHQQKGLGRLMMTYLLARARDAKARVILLDVRASNDAAVGLYRACGFERYGLRKGYYVDTGDDAILMRQFLSNI